VADSALWRKRHKSDAPRIPRWGSVMKAVFIYLVIGFTPTSICGIMAQTPQDF
jgi:hypothetical protein